MCLASTTMMPCCYFDWVERGMDGSGMDGWGTVMQVREWVESRMMAGRDGDQWGSVMVEAGVGGDGWGRVMAWRE